MVTSRSFIGRRSRLIALGGIVIMLTACTRPDAASTSTTVAPTIVPDTATTAESTTAVATTTPATTSASTNAPTAPATTAVAPTAPADDVANGNGAEPASKKSGSTSSAGIERNSVSYDHPNLGPVTISVWWPDGSGELPVMPSVRATVDATGATVYEWTSEEPYASFDFADDGAVGIDGPVDALGHVFFVWNPGRFDGVSYLVPTADGFDSDGTLSDDYRDGHYNATIEVGGDLSYWIDQHFLVCEPDCANGYSYSHIWKWNGTTYSGDDSDPGRSGTGDAVAAAKQFFVDYLWACGGRDYENAWSMLDAGYQEQIGGRQEDVAYKKFVEFWSDIDVVGTNKMEPTVSEDSISFDTIIWYQYSDGSRKLFSETVTVTTGDHPSIYVSPDVTPLD